MDWESKLLEASTLLEAREHYQRRLGQLAYDIAAEFGPSHLKVFSDQIKETYGMTVSVSTLRNYRWVYMETKDLELPDDLSYRTLQYIASAKDPVYWAERIKAEGLSSPDILFLLRKEKGLDKKNQKEFICQKCGATNVL